MKIFGGKVRLIGKTGGALPLGIKDFYRNSEDCGMVEVYGEDEVAGVVAMTIASDTTDGHVGGPLLDTQLKIEKEKDL